ncbi:unnamed protein product [Rotaria sp. Silwood1]|nr:unnamed protein product [Rotaria sp. Silwood1]
MAKRATNSDYGQSTVQTRNGKNISLSNVQIGEEILVQEGNKLIIEPIYDIIHSEKSKFYRFIHLTVFKHHQNSTYSIGISLKYLIFKYEISTSVFASEIQLGDHLQLVNQDEIIPEKIIQIDEIISQDFSAPLTPSSTNIVNNLVSSNYAEARNHHLAHLVMQPHRLWRFILGLKQIIQTDFDWYISILYYFPHKTRLLHIL